MGGWRRADPSYVRPLVPMRQAGAAGDRRGTRLDGDGRRGHADGRPARRPPRSAAPASAAPCSSPSASSAWACCSASTRWSRGPSAPVDRDECDRWLVAGLWLAAGGHIRRWPWCSSACGGCCRARLPWRRARRTSTPTSPIVALSLPPLLGYAALRRYLQALSRVRADRLHAGLGQPGQRRRQLAADLRHRPGAGARCARLRVGDGDLARLHAARARLGRLAPAPRHGRPAPVPWALPGRPPPASRRAWVCLRRRT